MKIRMLVGAVLMAANVAHAGDSVTEVDRAAILTDLERLAAQCAALEDGAAETHIFGIQIIRVGDTCAVVNGDELGFGSAAFLQSAEAPDWAGVGLWVKVKE